MQHSTPHALIAGIAASLLLVTSTGHGPRLGGRQ